MNILMIGAGAWGTALAIAAARHPRGHRVVLAPRDVAQRADMQTRRENTRYLPGHRLPDRITLQDMDSRPWDDPHIDLIVLGTPMAALRPLLLRVAHPVAPLVWLCKGFEAPLSADQSGGLMGHEVLAQMLPRQAAGLLSGPSFAQEVASGKPTALVAASTDPSVCQTMVAAFHSESLRVYANDDIVGVEVGGAVKNVLAIATGLCDGLSLGLNARAALITRGLAEMTRLGVALGGRAETFMGLSGLGDLVLTATGDLSRNRRIGQLLAQGLRLEQALASLGHVAEGVYTARTVAHRARALGVDMPITDAVVALLDGALGPADAVAALMARQPRDEHVSG